MITVDPKVKKVTEGDTEIKLFATIICLSDILAMNS
jgi:hypothetical protein